MIVNSLIKLFFKIFLQVPQSVGLKVVDASNEPFVASLLLLDSFSLNLILA